MLFLHQVLPRCRALQTLKGRCVSFGKSKDFNIYSIIISEENKAGARRVAGSATRKQKQKQCETVLSFKVTVCLDIKNLKIPSPKLRTAHLKEKKKEKKKKRKKTCRAEIRLSFKETCTAAALIYGGNYD